MRRVYTPKYAIENSNAPLPEIADIDNPRLVSRGIALTEARGKTVSRNTKEAESSATENQTGNYE